MTFSDPWPRFQGHSIFQRRMSQNDAFYVVQLQILQCNVPLTRGPSAIAQSLDSVYSLIVYV